MIASGKTALFGALIGLLTTSGAASRPLPERAVGPMERGAAGAGTAWVAREALVMGTWLRVELEGRDEAEAWRIVDRVFDAANALERRWSTWEAASELSDLNRAPTGTPVSVSDETLHLLLQAWDLSIRTEGAFDPVVGALVDAWDLRGVGRVPSEAELARALSAVGRGCFELSPVTRTVIRRCERAWIDTGAFGKGGALSAIARILDSESISRAYIDLGGQTLVRGSGRVTGTPLAIADPRDRERPAYALTERAGSYATSAQSERWIEAGGRRWGHVLDPRTGRPVEAWGSVTVRSDDPVEADALSTALFVMGPRDGIRWLAARPDVEAVLLVVHEEGLVACGRTVLLRATGRLVPEAREADAGFLAPGLRACP